MKAAARHRDGEPDVLTYQDVAEPEARDLIADLMTRAAAGELTMSVERSFSMADEGAAHAFADGARPLGRVSRDMAGPA